MALKLSHKDVIDYFDEVNPDVAELVLGIIQDNLEKKEAKRAKISANLKKARAAKGSGNGQAAQFQPGVDQAQPVTPRRPGRPPRADNPNQALSASSASE